MRIRKNDRKNMIRAGAFVSILSLVLMVMIAAIGKEAALFKDKVLLRARVTDVSNLRTGSYVELMGLRIGSVKEIRIIAPESVEITLEIQEEQLQWIKQDSKVTVAMSAIVGDRHLEILGGSVEAPVFDPARDILEGRRKSGVRDMMEKGKDIAVVTERVLENIEEITLELKEARLGEMVTNVNRSMEKFNGILGQIQRGPGTLNALIYERDLHDDLRSLLGGAQRNKVIKFFIRESIKSSEKKSKLD